jgi:hypothetical protein
MSYASAVQVWKVPISFPSILHNHSPHGIVLAHHLSIPQLNSSNSRKENIAEMDPRAISISKQKEKYIKISKIYIYWHKLSLKTNSIITNYNYY